MKKNILTVAALVVFAGMQAQIQTNNGVTNGITNSNVLLDGSSGFSTEAGAGPYVGKGVVIPSVDLVNFQFDLSQADGFTFPTYFDGMIVYNNATGNTLTTGNRPSTSLAVIPGFYYFYNPNGASNGNITGGQWKALGGTATGDNLGNHSATQTLALNGFDLRLKGAADGNQALAYNATIDGPRLWGNAGGALGTINGTNALRWDNSGNIISPGTVTSGNGNNGKTILVPGTSTTAGYIGVIKGDGTTRLGYIGYDNTNLNYVAENSAIHAFKGNIVNSDIGFNAGTGNVGKIAVYPGDGSHAGNISIIKGDGSTRLGYIGDNNSDIGYVSISPSKHAFSGGIVNSDIGFNAGSGSVGKISVFPGDNAHSGNVTFIKGDGSTSLGYIGYDNTNLNYVALNGALHSFTGNAITSEKTIYAGTGAIGKVALVPGTSTTAGYVGIIKGDGSTRIGFIGYDNNNIQYNAEGGALHNFIGGAVVTQNSLYTGSGAVGKVALVPGTNTTAGYMGIIKGDGSTRVGFIGYDSTNMSYTAELGIHVFNTTIQTPRVQGPSDRRFKKDITPIYNATEKLNQLNGYTYTWKDKKEFPGQTLGTGKDMGVIAQEVEKVFPDAVMTNKEGYKSVNYNALIPVLIESLKEAHREIKELKEELKKK
ncbi:tail fiber domain-containing protein [uncultured Chryseobacterium sp.]|uniref:tail fiber domain-containing protein n=1 Tax=uncultured Chryseobacterium sp. TaxID=259322 RepID=UPI0026012E7F|nr:tail fiber domain-containing protein [uncultured Chryseobacterium sp.]